MRITTVALRAFALGAAIGAADGYASRAVATASATVIAPIAVGKFAPGTGGKVTVSTSGERVANNTILSPTSIPATAARFDVTGDPAATYDITITAPASLDDGAAHSMALSTCTDLTAANTTSGNVAAGTLSGGGSQSVFVGGSLSVGVAQVPGVYSGNITVTVEYN